MRAVAATVIRECIRHRGVDGRIVRTGIVGVAHEVVAPPHAGAGEVLGLIVGAGTTEVRVVVVDAGVDDADLDALARVAELIVGDVSTGERLRVLDGRRRVLGGLGHLGDRVDPFDTREAGDGADLGVVDVDARAIPSAREGLADGDVDALLLGVADELVGGGAVEFDEPTVRNGLVAELGKLLADARCRSWLGRVGGGRSGHRRCGDECCGRQACAEGANGPAYGAWSCHVGLSFVLKDLGLLWPVRRVQARKRVERQGVSESLTKILSHPRPVNATVVFVHALPISGQYGLLSSTLVRKRQWFLHRLRIRLNTAGGSRTFMGHESFEIRTHGRRRVSLWPRQHAP